MALMKLANSLNFFMWDKIMYNCIYHWIEKIASSISVWAWHKRVKLLRKEQNSKRTRI
jgi:hypothetical protein